MDIYVEYTGTALLNVINQSAQAGADKTFRIVSRAYRDRFDLEWLESLPAEHEEAGVRHVRLPAALEVRIDARARRGLVLRAR